MDLARRINASIELADLPITADKAWGTDCGPVTATPVGVGAALGAGVAAGAALVGAVVAGAAFGQVTD